jgi:hypothetical protein
MDRYSQKATYPLDEVIVDHGGDRYKGRGFMHWDPAQGFHIEALFDGSAPRRPGRVEFHSLRVLGPDDLCSIRMRPRRWEWAHVPNVAIGDNLEFLSERRLSLDVGRVTFASSYPRALRDREDELYWFGSALYGHSRVILPDQVETVTRVGDQEVAKKISMAAIRHEGLDGETLLLRANDDSYLEAHWRLPRRHWTRRESWHWAEAVRDSLSLLAGQGLALLWRGVDRGGRSYLEVRRETRAQPMGVSSPFGEMRPLNKDLFVRLTAFLARGGHQAHVVRNVLAQMEEASRQRTWQGQELLLATILEALLRTLYRRPFVEGAGYVPPVTRPLLTQFRDDYLSEAWVPFTDRAFGTWRRLRHRNAHPDWLAEGGEAVSQEQQARALDDLIYLSRIYGYMILALAGITGVQPSFPRPHREWLPSLVMETRDDPEEEEQGV